MAAPRKLGRDAKHRRALFRNLVTALFEHESITTTHAKAKETQRLADKLISLTKKTNTERAISLASSDIFKHGEILPKLFGELKDRYKGREGGFTRVLRLEPRLSDSAPQSIVELVDGSREMKFWYLARIVARLEQQGLPIDNLTKTNVQKLIRYRQNGQEEFDQLVERMKREFYSNKEVLQENFSTMDEQTPSRSPFNKNAKKEYNYISRSSTLN